MAMMKPTMALTPWSSLWCRMEVPTQRLLPFESRLFRRLPTGVSTPILGSFHGAEAPKPRFPSPVLLLNAGRADAVRVVPNVLDDCRVTVAQVEAERRDQFEVA